MASPVSDLFLLLVVVVVLLLWFEQRKVQEIAVDRCRRACKEADVQFLDDIAPVWRVRFVRDSRGAWRLRRVFTFDYYTASGERRHGSIVMLGRTAVDVRLEDNKTPDAGVSNRIH